MPFHKLTSRFNSSGLRIPNVRKFCTPAKTYLILAVISIAYSVVANIGSDKVFRLGNMKTYVGNTYLVILLELVYLFVWGWFIDWLCRRRAYNIAWFIVMLPYVLAIMAFLGHYKMGGVKLNAF
ncbi:MAG: hypothetical protein CMF51_01405 [Legionellales bacterium]|nr:hypothetical protein [Legionellales bacterium]